MREELAEAIFKAVLTDLFKILMLWWLWDTWVVVLFKGVPAVDFWGALLLVTIGNLLSPLRSTKE